MRLLGAERAARVLADGWMLVTAGVAGASFLLLWIWGAASSVLPPPSHGAQPAGAGTLAWFAVFLASWVLMTAAMMLPSALPLLRTLQRAARGVLPGSQAPLLAAAAYLGVWATVGISVWVCILATEVFHFGHGDPITTARLAGAGLAAAGLFGLSPLARTCLRACRRPFGFMARYWRGGDGNSVRVQAARIGAAYGVSCVGCCVPMIGMMFVTGMTSLVSMVALAIVMVAMKVRGQGVRLASVLAVALVLAGVAVGMLWMPLCSHHHH